MRCIAYRSLPFPLQQQQQQQQHTKKLQPKLLEHIHSSSSSSSSSYGFCSGAPLSSSVMPHLRRSNATMNDLLSLPITKSHPKPGDISVFLQTGGVLVFAYWIANFVVPNWISKSMGYDNMGENNQDTTTTTTTTTATMPKPKEGDNNAAGEEQDEEQRVISSQSKKRGFGGSSSSSRRKSKKI